MPRPATVHAMVAPQTPVCAAKRAGSWKTPAPTMEPTTIAVSAGRASLVTRASSAVPLIVPPEGVARSAGCLALPDAVLDHAYHTGAERRRKRKRRAA